MSPIRYLRVKRHYSPVRNLGPIAGFFRIHRGGAGSILFSSLQKTLDCFPDYVVFFSACQFRLSDTRPCFRFLGVVLNTHQSPIWIKRWPAALSAIPACLGSYEPQKTFGTPAASKSRGTPRVAVFAVTVDWLAGACAWSSPFRAHGRGVSSIYQPRLNAELCGG